MATKAQEQRIFREAVQAALRLDEYDFALSYDEPFALRFDDDEETWFGAVTVLEETYQRFVMARGPEGLRWIRDTADDAPDEDELDRFTERIEFILTMFADVLPARRPALLAAGATSLRDGLVPEFSAKERNKSAHDLRPRDAKRLTSALFAVTELFETHLDELEAEHPAGILPTLHISGDWRAPDVRFELAAHVDDLGRADVPVRRGGFTNGWPVVEERWSVAVVEHTPSAGPDATPDLFVDDDVAGDPGAAADQPTPGPAALLLVVDTDTKALVGCMHTFSRSPRRLAQKFVRGVIASPADRMVKRFAGHITFVDPVLRAFVAEALEADGVTCVAVERDEAIEYVSAHFDAVFAEAAAARDRGDVEVDDEEFDDAVDDDEDDHVHGPGCAHGHGDGHFDDDEFDEDEVEEPPDAVAKILRDAGLTGGPGAPPR